MASKDKGKQMLTPVRVRGKKRALPVQDEDTQKSNKVNKPESVVSKISRNRKHQTSFSPIELLPKEMIDHIFSFTVNPNLPRSSLVIAHLLAGKRTLDWHCRRLFRCFSYVTLGAFRFYAVVDPKTVEDGAQRSKAQRETLTIPGVTSDYFISFCRSILNEEKQRFQHIFDHGLEKDHKTETIYQGMEHVDEFWLPSDIREPETVLHEESRLEEVINSLQISFKHQFSMPSKLIRYPLDADSFKLLKFLVRTGVRIDKWQSLDNERAHEAWSKAVRAKDYRMVRLFMNPGLDVRPSQDELEAALEAINWDAAMFKLIAIYCSMRITRINERSSKRIKGRGTTRIDGRGIAASHDYGYDYRYRYYSARTSDHVHLKHLYEIDGLIPWANMSQWVIERHFPTVWVRVMAKHPEGSLGRAIIDETSNSELGKILVSQVIREEDSSELRDDAEMPARLHLA